MQAQITKSIKYHQSLIKSLGFIIYICDIIGVLHFKINNSSKSTVNSSCSTIFGHVKME